MGSSGRHPKSSFLDPLNIASSQASPTLNDLKLHWNSRFDCAIALSRKSCKVKEDIVSRSLSCDHANARIEIEPAYDASYYWQTARTRWWYPIGPLLLRNANLPHLRRIICLVAVIRTRFHDGTQVVSLISSIVGLPTKYHPL